jgi:AI-2 transport protein TqsA
MSRKKSAKKTVPTPKTIPIPKKDPPAPLPAPVVGGQGQNIVEEQGGSTEKRELKKLKFLDHFVDDIQVIVFSVLLLVLVLLGALFHYLSPILKPLFIAIFLYYLCRPGTQFLIRYHVPYWISFLIIVLLLIGIFLALGLTVYYNIGLFEKQLPEYEKRLHQFADRLTLLIAPHFKGESEEIPFDLKKLLRETFSNFSPQEVIRFVFGTIMGFLGNFLIVLVYLFFIILEGEKLPKRIAKAFPKKEEADRFLEVGRKVGEGIKNYLIIKTGVSLATGITAGLVLYGFQLDYWLLWAILTFVANFIPYIGSLGASVFPTLLAFIVFPDPLTAVFLALCLLATQMFWGNFLDPYLSGKYLNVSPLILLFLLAYWGWLWGIIGMILAFPFAVAIRTVLINIEKTKEVGMLMSAE